MQDLIRSFRLLCCVKILLLRSATFDGEVFTCVLATDLIAFPWGVAKSALKEISFVLMRFVYT